jgi:hypothetical protein
MGNRTAREWLLKQEIEATWERLRSASWLPDRSHRAFGSGAPRVQIIHSPSFNPSSFWEVCQKGDEWILYTSTVVTEWFPGPLSVQGYDPAPFDARLLRDYFERLISLSLPVAPYLTGMAGVDGAVTQLTLFGDVNSRVQFRWWSDYPPAWAPLVQVADEMLAAFRKSVEHTEE